jgi:hypothetical protein
MARKISFDDVAEVEHLFKLLSDECNSVTGVVLPFKDWEILHELDRQARRKEYDHSPARQEQRRRRVEERAKINAYLALHPDVEHELKEKVVESLNR